MTIHNIGQLRKTAADSTLSNAERAGAQDILRAWSETLSVYDQTLAKTAFARAALTAAICQRGEATLADLIATLPPLLNQRR